MAGEKSHGVKKIVIQKKSHQNTDGGSRSIDSQFSDRIESIVIIILNLKTKINHIIRNTILSKVL